MREVYFYKCDQVVQATLTDVGRFVPTGYLLPYGVGLSEREALKNLTEMCKQTYLEVANYGS